MTSQSAVATSLDHTLFRAVVDSATDGIIVTDHAGTIRLMNPAAGLMFGYDPQELLGFDAGMLLAEPGRNEPRTFIGPSRDRVWERLTGKPRELEARRKDGSGFPIHLTVTPIHEGDLHLFAGIVHDLSVHTRVEQELLESEERNRAIIDSALDAVITIDAEGIITGWNAQAEIMFGYPGAEVLGKRLSDTIIPRQYKEAHEQGLKKFAETGEGPLLNSRFEITALHHDGHEFPVELAIVPLHACGRTRFSAFVRDISDRVQAASEVLRMRGYLQNIVDSMPSILVGVDTECQVTEWNQGAERATGIPVEEAVGAGFTELFPEYEPQLEDMREAIRRHVPVHIERLATEEAGETRYADVMIYPLLADGTTGAVIRVDDITDRVRLEQMMVEAEKMMSVGGLAAGMAHEINNPLSGILQSCQNIQRRLSAELDANRRTAAQLGLDLGKVQRYLQERDITGFLEGIQDAAGRASRIVVDMLAFSRQRETEFVETRIDALLDSVVRLAASDYDLKKQYDFKQIEIVKEYDSGLPSLYCDPPEIEQVMLNLIKNAAQAMAEGGKPPYRLTLRTRCDGDTAQIEVEDNGPGMDEQTRKRVFEPFFTTKPAGIGTGLGLSVSYFIITEQHRGTLSVTSTPGKGARFVIRLPLGRAVAGKSMHGQVAAAGGG
ncbi:MAG: PAS domain S-box protein [Pseudomonadota bacterium]